MTTLDSLRLMEPQIEAEIEVLRERLAALEQIRDGLALLRSGHAESQHETVHKTPPEIPEPEPEQQAQVSSGRALDLRNLITEQRDRAVLLGQLTAKQREALVLKHIREHHPTGEVEGPVLRDEIGMASSDFGFAMRALKGRGAVEDVGYVLKPGGGKTQAKRWKLASPDNDTPRRGPTPEARRVRRETGNYQDLREVEANGVGTLEGRILTRLQFTPSLADDLTEWLDVPAEQVAEALMKLLNEGEIEQTRGGIYKAVPIVGVR